MEQVLAVYQRPYNVKYPVVCLDESPKQLISEVRQPFTDEQGTQYVDYEYAREGVADMYMIVEPLAGRREVRVADNHNRLTYAQIVAHIAEQMYPKAEKITLVEDNLSHRGAVLINYRLYMKYFHQKEHKPLWKD